MFTEGSKVGLVLAGGGAKGAYQVGAIKALAERGVKVHAVSGTSIGALNGLVVATADNLAAAARTLEEDWLKLVHASPVQFQIDLKRFSQMLQVLLPQLASRIPALPLVSGTLATLSGRSLLFAALLILRGDKDIEGSWASPTEIEAQVDRFLGLQRLDNGLPLYVSAFQSDSAEQERMHVLLGHIFGVRDTPESTVLHVQSLRPEARRAALLASAALPLVFPPRDVDGRRFVDGGVGGAFSASGNTPVQALVDKEKCTHVIVSHLHENTPWSRGNLDATVIELRPRAPIGRHAGIGGFGGDFLDMLNFTDAIPSWIAQGYEDTHRTLGKLADSLATVHASETAIRRRDAAVSALAADEPLR